MFGRELRAGEAKNVLDVKKKRKKVHSGMKEHGSGPKIMHSIEKRGLKRKMFFVFITYRKCWSKKDILRKSRQEK